MRSTSDWTGFETVSVLSSEQQQWENNIKSKKYQLTILKEVRDSGGRKAEIAVDRFYQKEGKID